MTMKYCTCTGTITSSSQSTCDGCLVAHKIIVGCGQGLKPCGGEEGTTIIDLKDYNKNPAGAVYSLKPGGYDTSAYSSVTLTSAGILTIVTGSDNFSPHTVHPIEYIVTKDKMKTFGEISFCFDSPCGSGCTTCNTCTGECYGASTPGAATVPCGSIGNTFDVTSGLNLESCDETNTFSLTAPDQVSATIDENGVITYDLANGLVAGAKYRVNWTLECSKYGMTVSGFLDITVADQCEDVECDPGSQCNNCTGECEELESGMIITKTGIAAESGGGTIIT